MKSLQYSTQLLKVISIVILAFYSTIASFAQTPPTFEAHEVIEIGNGMKIEILRNRGTGENEEWDVIYYTDKRQLGKRKWERTSKIIELKQTSKINTGQPKQVVKPTEIVGKTSIKNKKVQQGKPEKQEKTSQSFRDDAATTKSTVTTAQENKGFVKPKRNETSKAVDSIRAVIQSKLNETSNLLKADTILNSIRESKKPSPEINILKSHASAVPVSLADCYRIARDKNLELKQAGNLVASNFIDHKTAQYSLLPSVSYNLGHYFSFGKNIDPVTNAFVNNNFSGGYTAVNLQLQLFSGFSRLNTIKQSAYNIQSAEYAKKRMELELLTNITLIYARLLQDKEQILIEKKNLEGTSRQIEVVNEKIKVGRLTKYEFYTFNARLNTQKANLVTLQNDSSSASQDLKQLLNISYKENIEITPLDTSALSTIYDTNISSAEFVENVLVNHPAIKQAQMQKQVAEMGEKIAKSNYYPSLSVGGNIASNYNADQTNLAGGKIPLYTQLNDNLGKNININLRVPLFSQMQNANRVKKEVINISNAQIALEQAHNAIVTNTIKLVNDFNTAKEKYLTSRTAWEQNNLSYSLFEEKYRLGQISSMELLLAQDMQNASALQYVQGRLQLFFQFQLMELLKGY